MGLDYSINLYVPTRAIEIALQETVAMARPDPIQNYVMLPDMRIISVPFTTEFGKREPAILAPGTRSVLDTCLWFPRDADVGVYVSEEGGVGEDFRRGREYVGIGRIYLHISVGPDVSEFAFTAATTKMSVMLANSRAVHEEFLRLLRTVGGISAVIDTERYEYWLLEDLTLTVDMSDRVGDEWEWHNTRRSPSFIAELASRARQLNKTLAPDRVLPSQ